MFGLYLTYYRELMRHLVDWIPLPFHWKISQWYLDGLAINFVFAAAAARAIAVVKYYQAKQFIILIFASAFLLIAWIVGASLVRFVDRFSRSSISEANARLAKWDPELKKLRKSHPSSDFAHIEEQIREDKAIVAQHTAFLTVTRWFIAGTLLVLLASGVFFLLNGYL